MKFGKFFIFLPVFLIGCAPPPPHDPDILTLAASAVPRVEAQTRTQTQPATPPPSQHLMPSATTKSAVKKTKRPTVSKSSPQPLPSPAAASCVTPQPNAPFKVGETVMMNIVGEKDLSGLFVIADDGLVRLPLIGHQKAAGLLPNSFAQALTSAYKNGYLTNPVIAVTKGPSCEVKTP